MNRTRIEWTEVTWNPIRGCSHVSEGCRNCYAAQMAHRFSGPGQPYEGLTRMTPAGPRWTGAIRLVPEMLDLPLRWQRPRMVFVNSMSDLFHEDVPFEYIDKVWAVMALAPRHIFQVLTKRPERMAHYLSREDLYEAVLEAARELRDKYPGLGSIPISDPARFPLPNVWLGVSVENQEAADERIPYLLRVPAAVRFLSCEPLLGPVELTDYLWEMVGGLQPDAEPRADGIDWIIVGGESGPKARPMHPDWVRSLRDQAAAAGVPFFFKQWGTWSPLDRPPVAKGGWPEEVWVSSQTDASPAPMAKKGKHRTGALLDGREWREWPEA